MIYTCLIFYILLSSTLFFLVKSNPYNNLNLKSTYFLKPLFLILSIIMGFRALSVGVDTYHYKALFDLISDVDLELLLTGFKYEQLEIGFVLFNKISSLLVDNYLFFQIISSFLFCYLMMNFIRYNSENFILTSIIFISIGFYLVSFNIFRQSLAVAFLATSWTYFIRNQYTKTFLFYLVAISLHTSSILFVLAYLLYSFRESKYLKYIYPVLLVLFVLYFQVAISFSAEIFSSYGNYYSNARKLQEANAVKILWGIEFLISIYIVYFSKRSSLTHYIIAMMSMFYVLSNFIGLYFNYFERIGYIFIPFTILTFDIFGSYIRRYSVRLVYNVCVVTCFLFYFSLSSTSSQYTYHFFNI